MYQAIFCNRKSYFQITTNDGEINPKKSLLTLLNLLKLFNKQQMNSSSINPTRIVYVQ
jgi:hypothetical protein